VVGGLFRGEGEFRFGRIECGPFDWYDVGDEGITWVAFRWRSYFSTAIPNLAVPFDSIMAMIDFFFRCITISHHTC
jgi:hypothetical protein